MQQTARKLACLYMCLANLSLLPASVVWITAICAFFAFFHDDISQLLRLRCPEHSGKKMASKACMQRLQKEYRTLQKEPVPHVSAHPHPNSLLEWHFVLEGDKDTAFKGGVYHGKIVFPPQYPFKPPSLSLYTPNGRFATNTKLCLSMTDYHPESWNPLWSVGTILTGLLSFMHDSQPTTGSITSTPEEKQRLAAESLSFNMKNPLFKKLFPEWVEFERQQHAQIKLQPTNMLPTQQLSPLQGSQQQQAAGTLQQGQQGQHATPGHSNHGMLATAHKPQSAGSMLLTFAAVCLVVALAVGPILSWCRIRV